MTAHQLTCDETQALMSDALDGMLSDTARATYDAHLAGCADCRSLAADLSQLRRDAASLPTLTPSRDLWSGIEARLGTPVVALGERRPPRLARWTSRQMAAAAAVLVAVTAGSTWLATTRTTAPVRQASAPAAARTVFASVADQKGIDTYEVEIAKLRDILVTRRSELDSTTVQVLEKNLTVIDKAIAESKAALAADPASTFLAGSLNRAYDTKLALLRSAALLPSRT